MLRAICICAAWLIAGTSFAQTIPPQTPPVIGGPPPAIVGLSPCENLIGIEKDNCLKKERARLGNTGGRAAGAGGTHAPGSTGTGHGTMGAQNIAPSGTTR